MTAILWMKYIFVVRKSYNRQKAQDIAYLVLFCYYILCFCRWTKSLNLTAAFRRFFQKTGLELTTYRFCSIGYYNFIIIFKREQVYRSSHREFFGKSQGSELGVAWCHAFSLAFVIGCFYQVRRPKVVCRLPRRSCKRFLRSDCNVRQPSFSRGR